jgi:predicted amidohydrolase
LIQKYSGLLISPIIPLMLAFSMNAFASGEAVLCAQVLAPMDQLKVAAVQYPLSEGKTRSQFLAKMHSYIVSARAQGAEIVVFPELVTTETINWNGLASEITQLHELAAHFTPEYIQWLQSEARDNQIAILGGTTPRLIGTRTVNTAVLAFPNGNLVLQDKLFLTPDEKLWNWSPGEELKAFQTPWGKTVITTCFDCEFPAISKLVSQASPEVIFVPSWTSSEHGLNRVDWTAKARAIEHFAYVVKTGTVPDPSAAQIPQFGQASIISPQDAGFPNVVAEGVRNQDQIVYATLDLKSLRAQRLTSGYFPDSEQNKRTAPLSLISLPGTVSRVSQ